MVPGESYVVGPLIVLVVVAGLALMLRWAYGSSRPALPAPDEPADFGLLQELAVVDTDDTAHAVRALLSDAGIRSTRATTPGGHVRVLVFAADFDRARQLVGPR
jgi:hypothetical protein